MSCAKNVSQGVLYTTVSKNLSKLYFFSKIWDGVSIFDKFEPLPSVASILLSTNSLICLHFPPFLGADGKGGGGEEVEEINLTDA